MGKYDWIFVRKGVHLKHPTRTFSHRVQNDRKKKERGFSQRHTGHYHVKIKPEGAQSQSKRSLEESKAADILIIVLIPRSLSKHLFKLPGMEHLVMVTLTIQYTCFEKRFSISNETSFSYLGSQGKETSEELSCT